MAELKSHAAYDQCDQHKQQCQIEAAEHRGIPVREGRKHRAARREEPDFIAVPEWPNGAGNNSPLFLVSGDERQKHSHSIVEAFQEEEAGKQDDNQEKPQDVEIHALAPFLLLIGLHQCFIALRG